MKAKVTIIAIVLIIITVIGYTAYKSVNTPETITTPSGVVIEYIPMNGNILLTEEEFHKLIQKGGN